MRGALILVVIATAAPALAAPRPRGTTRDAPAKDTADAVKDKPAESAPPPPKPVDPAVQAIFDRIVKGPDAATRKTAIEELDHLAPKIVGDLSTYLARPRTSSVDDRRKVLEAIAAQVPDKAGRFTQPARKTATEAKADDDLDWLAALLALDPATIKDTTPAPRGSAAPPAPPDFAAATAEVIADDAAIRALAATKDMHASDLVFDAAFGTDTMIYRDECGRYLRKMEPYSIPGLTLESQAKNYDRKRYATYQLERLDRQEPGKALAATTGDEAVMIAILGVFRATHHREAVHAVWTKVNADSPRLRKAARDAWMDYITGPPPAPAPKKKLSLPGGKLTKKEKPLWLTYRELADNELRKAANELLGQDLPIEDPTLDDSDEWRKKKTTVKVDLVDLTNQLFAFFDAERVKRESAQWATAKALADKGDLAGATAQLDRMLAASPDRADRAAMAKLFFERGKQLEAKSQWADAAAAYSKAHGLDPKGTDATNALAAHHYTLGKALEAQGKDGGPDYRRAIALRPDYAPAKQAEHDAAVSGRPVWMLYGAATAVLAALVLFAAAMVRRRSA